MKFCKDCRYVETAEASSLVDSPLAHLYWTCCAPQTFVAANPLSGELERSRKYCDTLRGPRDSGGKILWLKWSRPPVGYCGKEGHWFEPAESGAQEEMSGGGESRAEWN